MRDPSCSLWSRSGGGVAGGQAAPEPLVPAAAPTTLAQCRERFVRFERFVRRIEHLDNLLRQNPKLNEQFKECQRRKPQFIHGLDFVTKSRGWAVGWEGLILHTADRGLNWTTQTSGTREHLLAVKFVTGETGLAVGDDGIVLGTRDGGKTWIKKADLGDKRLWSLSCTDAKHCWSGGDHKNRIYATLDGGGTWVAQGTPTVGSIRSIVFVDAKHGWATSTEGKIIATEDGGNRWRIAARKIPAALWSVHFLDQRYGWSVGTRGQILHTANGGRTWMDQSTNLVLPRDFPVKAKDITLTAVRFFDRSRGWAAGLNGVIIATVNGGKTWRPQRFEASATASFYALSVMDEDTAWVAGNSGHVMATIDGGKSWFPVRGLFADVTKLITPYLDGAAKKNRYR
jgi:photosystem II stability/assembly factor-like uncharacterized protein